METKTRPEVGLHHRMKIAREHAGITRQEMADHLPCSPMVITNYERGRTVPVSAVIEKWAERCGVELDWMDPEHSSRSRCFSGAHHEEHGIGAAQ